MIRVFCIMITAWLVSMIVVPFAIGEESEKVDNGKTSVVFHKHFDGTEDEIQSNIVNAYKDWKENQGKADFVQVSYDAPKCKVTVKETADGKFQIWMKPKIERKLKAFSVVGTVDKADEVMQTMLAIIDGEIYDCEICKRQGDTNGEWVYMLK